MSTHRSSADYIDRTIETVRVHRDAANSWPQWANILADEIEDLRADVDAIGAALGEPCAECGHIDWRSDGYIAGRKESYWERLAHEGGMAVSGKFREKDEWFIPEGDRTCGVLHTRARATCMKRRGHDGPHATPQGTWIDGPWCEYPPEPKT